MSWWQFDYTGAVQASQEEIRWTAEARRRMAEDVARYPELAGLRGEDVNDRRKWYDWCAERGINPWTGRPIWERPVCAPRLGRPGPPEETSQA